MCCGTKRRVEIRCPESCGYLQSARTHPPVAAKRREERELLLVAAALQRTTQQQRAIFAFLQTAIAAHAKSAVPALLDRDVAEACAALASTFETAARGIIYEQQATGLPAQRLLTGLRQQIEQALHPSQRPVDRDLAIALRATETMASRAPMELAAGDRSYLELIERKIASAPDGDSEASPGSSLIVEG